MHPPATTGRGGISRKSRTPRTDAKTGSSSFAVEMKAALSYFRPQLKTLCPRSVQKSAMPSAVSQLTGS